MGPAEPQRPVEPAGGRVALERAAALAERYANLDGAPLLRAMVAREFPGRIAVVSSFGAESAVLLALVAEVRPSVPIIFLETGKHFAETRRYRDSLIEILGLEDVRLVLPEARRLAAEDPRGDLWESDPDACCGIRKVAPLTRALAGWEAWITGRKRYQGGQRAALPTIEAAGGKVKVNPLATWSKARIEAELERRDLPRHPLEDLGYTSIGCEPCTDPASEGGCLRAGRWAGLPKTECGIHRAG